MAISLAAVSVKQLKRAIEIKERIEALELELSEILGETSAPITTAPQGRRRGRRKLSAAGRAAISAAAKARWANYPAKTKPGAKKDGRGRHKMSPAAKARLAEIARQRWARVKASGKTRL